jgi:hypothetical protein
MNTVKKQPRQNRSKAVLPVRVRGKDVSGECFEELAHTLDLTRSGARLGSIRRILNVPEQLTVVYRQRKMEFRVVWIKKLEGCTEFQIGLQAVAEDGESWGLNLSDFQVQQATLRASAAVSSASGAI